MSKPRTSDTKRGSGRSLSGSAWRLRPGLLFALAILSWSFPAMLTAQTQPVTFAGTTPESLGSGFNSPTGVAVDATGNIFVADNTNNAVKEIIAVNGGIPANPTILTLAVGFNGPDSVAVDASGDVFVASFGDNTVKEIVAVNGGIPANPTIRPLGSGFVTPSGVAVDTSGNVFVADMGNVAVKEIVAVNGSIPDNPTIRTLGGGFTNASGVAVDAAGDVFVADDTSVKEIVAVGGIIPANPTISTLGGGFVFAHGVAVDTSGDVFVAQTQTTFIEEMVAVDGSIPENPTFLTFGSGFLSPYGVFVDTSGDVFVADAGASDIEEIQTKSVNFGGVNVCPAAVGAPAPCSETLTFNFTIPAGIVGTPTVTNQGAPNPDFTLAPGGACGGPSGTACTVNVTFAPQVAGLRSGAATVTVAGSKATTLLSGTGLAPQVAFLPGVELLPIQPANAQEITGVAIDESGDVYYVDQNQNTVNEILNGIPAPLPFTGLSDPMQVAVDGAGSVYVLGGYISPTTGEFIPAVNKLDVLNNQTTIALSDEFLQLYSFAVDGRGSIYVSGLNGNDAGQVLRFDPNGAVTPIGGAFTRPQGLAVGADGTVYVAEVLTTPTTSTVYAISPAGVRRTIGSGFATPGAVAVDAGGALYVLENAADTIIAVDTAGVQSTVETLPSYGHDLKLDSNGSLYVALETTPATAQGKIIEFDRTTSAVDFPDVTVGNVSAPVATTVSNIGNQPLAIAGLAYTSDAGGGFAESPQPTSTPAECSLTAPLAAGASCLVTSVFGPPAGADNAGLYTGSFILSDNALNAAANGPATQVVSLEGAADGPAVTPVAMTLTGPVPSPLGAGQTGTFTVRETGAGGFQATGDGDTVNLTLSQGGAQIGTYQVTLANGTGGANVQPPGAGDYSLSAVDASNAALTATDIFTVQGASASVATIALASSPAAPYPSDQVFVTVTINEVFGYAPSGSVTYAVDDGAPVTANLVFPANPYVTSNSVVLPLGALAVGAHTLTVAYSGDEFYQPAGPQTLNITVAAPTLTLLSSERNSGFANVGTSDAVAVDAAGNVYLGDTTGQQVLMYSSAGTRTVKIAGVVDPTGLAFDANGDLYVSQGGANSVTEYTTGGETPISLAGLTPGVFNNPGKVAVDATGNVYIADTGNNRVVLYNFDSIAGLVATQDQLNAPQGVAVDTAGNIYIADTGNGRVIKINAQQTSETTIYTTPRPVAVTVDSASNVYVVDSSNGQLIRIDGLGHQIQVNSATGAASVDVATDNQGNFFLPNLGATVLEVTTNAGIKLPETQVGAAAGVGTANFLIPSTLGAAPSASAANLGGEQLFSVTNPSLNCSTALMGTTCSYGVSFAPALPGVLSGSFSLSNAASGTLLTTSIYGDGLAPLAVLEPGTGAPLNSPGLLLPVAIAVDEAANVYVADQIAGSILKLNPGAAPTALLTELETPAGVAVDGAGNVYATDSSTTIIQKITPQGTVTNAATGLVAPAALAVDGAGNLYVADSVNESGAVQKVDPLGNVTNVVVGLDATPVALALDSQGNIYYPAGDGTIAEVAPNGTPISSFQVGQAAGALAIDPGGEIYLANFATNQIVRVDTSGNQTVIPTAGTGISSLALDDAGNLYYGIPGNADQGQTPAVTEINRAATALNFGSVPIGTQSQTFIATVTDIGNQPLVLSGLTVPAPFSPQVGTATLCTGASTLTPGTDCQLAVAFTPAAVGPASGSATLTDNSLNNAASTQIVPLQGTGTGVTPASLALTGPATGVAGQSGTYTITELGAGGVAAIGDSDAVIILAQLGATTTSTIPDVTLVNGVGTFTFQYALGYTGIVAVDNTNNSLTQTLPITVTPAPTATTLALAVTPAAPTVAELVSVVVTLGGDQALPAATGTITYTLDGVAGANPIQVGVPNSPGAYVVSVPLGRLAVGPHSFVASYSGDANYLPAGPATLPFSVAPLVVTATTLAISSGGNAVATVASGTAVTLTAAIAAGGAALSPGLVTFCDATAAHCEDSAILGTAQLTTAGTATFKFVPGIGVHSYKAVFAGTDSFAGSTSAAGALTVTGLYPTVTTIASSGLVGDYTLTATVVGTSNAYVSPTGVLSFLDTSAGDTTLGTATLGASTAGLGFVNSSSPATGQHPVAMAYGDFNGDGIPDLATTNFLDNTVTILLGDGQGGFTAAAVSPATGSGPNAIVAGDFNGDGKTDLAVANATDNTVTVLLGNREATFVVAPATAATGFHPYGITSGDFNGDGITDLATVNYGDSTVTVLLGNGNGTFTPAPVAPSTGSGAGAIVEADFNDDGIADLAIPNGNDNTVTVLLGNGDGSFQAISPDLPTGNEPTAIAVADFTGDGEAGLAVANLGDNTVTIFLGNGNGTFTAAAGGPVASTAPGILAAGDFNGDGKPDLAVASFVAGTANGTLSVLLGNGDGTFAPAATPATGNLPYFIVVDDLNGDGVEDLAVSNKGSANVTVLLTQRTQSATAMLANVSIAGTGTHNIEASLPANAHFSASVSATTPLMGSEIPPTIASLTPNNASVGSGDTVVTITGTGFVTGAAVTVNGTSQAATFVTATELTTTITAANLANAGTLTLTVVNLDGTASNTAAFTVTALTGVLVTPSNLSFGDQAVGTTSAAQVITFANNTTAALTLNGITVNVGLDISNFAESDNCGTTTLAAGASCLINITFTPGGVGQKTALLDVYYNSTGQSVSLSGIGVGGILQVNPGNLKIIAGIGTAGYAGDGASATAAELSQPVGLAFDSLGNLYIADSSNNVIRKVDTSGVITTVAGNGTAGFSGDGGPATAAELNKPFGVEAGPAGTLYIEDTDNNRVRMVNAAGIITTIAGTGIFAFGGDGGPATSAYLGDVQGGVFDAAGDLYVSQCRLGAVRKIDTAGVITTIAGTGVQGSGGDGGPATSAGLGCPVGIALDAANNLFIADFGNSSIREVNTSGIIATIAGNGSFGFSGDGGPAVSATLNTPGGVAVDPAGNVYIADDGNNRIRKIDTSGIITTIAGGFKDAGSAGVNSPLSLTLDAGGNLYFSDTGNNAVRELFPTGVPAFPSTPVGTAAANETITLSNIGNLPVTIASQASFAVSGNTGDFSLVGGTCLQGATLAGNGGSCTLQVGFTPTAAGTRTLNVSVTDDALDQPQSFQISGTGTLVSQTIHFTPVAANPIYGAAPFAVAATATSGLPVAIAVQSGPATIAGNLVTITGAGVVTLTATQAGNAVYPPATAVTISFTVNPAALNVTANSVTSAYGQPLPALTDVITGFVYNDTVASAVTGAAALTTTATLTSAPGNYPIAVAKGTLAAANYTFTFVPGTLTIAQAAQTIAFTSIPARSYGSAAFTPTATATSGLPVTISVRSGPATLANNQVTVNGVGTVVLAGNQAGNADYSAAPTATTSFAVNPASTTVALNVTSSVVRTPNPVSLSATVSSPTTGETGTVTFLDGTTTLGQSTLSATDTAALNGVTLAAGSHTITASYSGSTDFAGSTSQAATVVVEPAAVALGAIAPTGALAGSSDTTITAAGTNFSPTAIVNFNGTPLATKFVSSTQLTAVIPAAQLVNAGTANVTVTDTYSSSASLAQTFTIAPVIAVTFTGPGTTAPGDQPPLTFTLQQAYPSALNGTMTLTFTPAGGNPDNPQVQFATGGRTFNFTLPANTTDTPLVLIQAGTVAGTITVSLQLTASGVNVTPPNLTAITIVVPPAAPTISTASFSASGNTLTVVVTGYSSTREIQSATFLFTPASGATLAHDTITVTANTLFETWYTKADSAQYGSAFTYTQLFTLSAPASAVGSVGVKLTNAIGISPEVTAQ
jgi:sugar lactone lactonase YvrE